MLLNNPKVSVIVANYNHGKYISQALDSLANQTFKDFEIIVADDGSTDDSLAVIANWITDNGGKLQHPVKKVYLAKNRGKWFALNTAISQASGKLITLNDSDDLSCPERIERQLMCMERSGSYHNLCGFFHCYTQEDMDKNKAYRTGKTMNSGALLEGFDYMSHKEVVKRVLEGRNIPSVHHFYTGEFETHGASCLFYKQLFDHGMKFLPGNMGLMLYPGEDSDFNTRMVLLLQKSSILLEPLYCYRRNTATNPSFQQGL